MSDLQASALTPARGIGAVTVAAPRNAIGAERGGLRDRDRRAAVDGGRRRGDGATRGERHGRRAGLGPTRRATHPPGAGSAGATGHPADDGAGSWLGAARRGARARRAAGRRSVEHGGAGGAPGAGAVGSRRPVPIRRFRSVARRWPRGARRRPERGHPRTGTIAGPASRGSSPGGRGESRARRPRRLLAIRRAGARSRARPTAARCSAPERINRRYELKSTGSGETGVLLRAGGAPWLVRSGEVVLVGSRFDPAWTALPISARFVPLLDALVNRIVRGELAALSAAPGDPVPMPDRTDRVAAPGRTVPVEGGALFRPAVAGLHFLLSGQDTIGRGERESRSPRVRYHPRERPGGDGSLARFASRGPR